MNDKKKVLITGASGQLGYELQRTAPDSVELIAASRADLDISDVSAVKAFVEKHKPVAIINAAAYTAVDKAESDEALATKVNVDGAVNLAKACADLDALLIHISTDYVFDGDRNATEWSDIFFGPVCLSSRFISQYFVEGINVRFPGIKLSQRLINQLLG